MEGLTNFLRHALVILGARHKERLGTGVALGLVFLLIHSSLVTAELLPRVPDVVSVAGSIALGVLAMFVPLWWDKKQRHIGEEEQKVLELMDELSRRGGLSDAQKKIAYTQMLYKQIEHYHPNKPLELKKDAEASVAEAMLDKREE